MRNPFKLAGLLLSLAMLAAQSGCGGSSSSGNAPNGSSFTITVTPATASVIIGSTRHFTAQAHTLDGTAINGVSFAWTSSDPNIAVSLGNGSFKGLVRGLADITATASLSVQAGQAPQIVTSNAASLSVVEAVEGVAALGAPIAGASVSLRDVHGQYAAGGTDAAGHFFIPTDGLTAPFLLKVVNADGRVLYGMTAKPGTANLDPYSDLLVRDGYALRGTDADAAFAGKAPLLSAEDTRTLDQDLSSALADALSAVGLDGAHFSLLATPFAADHTGFDAMLDASQVDAAAGRIRVSGETVLIRLNPTTGSMSWETRRGALAVLGSLHLP